MSGNIKTLELRSNVPILKISKGATFDFKIDVRGESNYIDLKSLKYNFKCNKYFQRIDIYINDECIHTYRHPEIIGNKSPYYFIEEKEILIGCNNEVKIRFVRNNDDWDMSDFRVWCDYITDNQISKDKLKGIPKINFIIVPVVLPDRYMCVELDPPRDSSFKKRIIFAGYTLSKGFVSEMMTLRVESQLNIPLDGEMRVGDRIVLVNDDKRLYVKLNRDMDNIVILCFIEYN